MAKPTEQLLDLIFLALDHAIKTLVGTNGPVTPFAIIESLNGERTLARFSTGNNPEEARQHARGHVAKTEDCVRYAIAADGAITANGQRIPVVLVEGGQRGEPHGFCFIQRFASSPSCRFAQPIRNPGIIEQPPVLGPPTAG